MDRDFPAVDAITLSYRLFNLIWNLPMKYSFRSAFHLSSLDNGLFKCIWCLKNEISHLSDHLFLHVYLVFSFFYMQLMPHHQVYLMLFTPMCMMSSVSVSVIISVNLSMYLIYMSLIPMQKYSMSGDG